VISRHFIDDLFLVPMKGKKGAARRVILNSGNGGHRFQGLRRFSKGGEIILIRTVSSRGHLRSHKSLRLWNFHRLRTNLLPFSPRGV
jgi:hypothetical protein